MLLCCTLKVQRRIIAGTSLPSIVRCIKIRALFEPSAKIQIIWPVKEVTPVTPTILHFTCLPESQLLSRHELPAGATDENMYKSLFVCVYCHICQSLTKLLLTIVSWDDNVRHICAFLVNTPRPGVIFYILRAN